MPKVHPARTREEVDRRFELWHTLPDDVYEMLGQPSINDYLGWSDEEYENWFNTGRLPDGTQDT